ncbi:MAG: hypothetical protein WBC02_10070 [Candidatus Aminicenantaceae bacterium]
MEQYAEVYYSLLSSVDQASVDQEMINSFTEKIEKLSSELNLLVLKMNQMADGREVLKQKLSKKYGREFLDRER